MTTHHVHATKLEAHCDLLNGFVNAGFVLQAAFIIDRGLRIDLPVEAFDGHPLTHGLQALNEQ